mgnify:CR=1 FL=1
MALNTEKNLKTYYTIKEVAKMFSLTESTLRYWETEFPYLKPRTTANNVRQYTDKDIEELRYIHNLVKVRGFKLAAARKIISSNRDGVDKSTKILEQLIDVRNQLQEMKEALDKIV